MGSPQMSDVEQSLIGTRGSRLALPGSGRQQARPEQGGPSLPVQAGRAGKGHQPCSDIQWLKHPAHAKASSPGDGSLVLLQMLGSRWVAGREECLAISCCSSGFLCRY